ncbi:hypothetical protein JXA80_07100 [bacterium]|nr:hypothetical protein [candidate division CSSED10-310 bacterium]
MELLQILKPLMELEYQMHRLYMWLGDAFQDHEEARTVFRKLAKEELQHRDMIHGQMAMVTERFREFDQIDADLDGILTLTGVLKEIADQRKTMELKQAVQVSVQIEQSAVEAHYRFLFAKANPVLAELSNRLAEADSGHVQRLIDFSHRIGMTHDAV